MIKLIKADMIRIFKSELFGYCLIFPAGLAVFNFASILLSIRYGLTDYEKINIKDMTFSMSVMMLLFAAVFTGIFIGKEFSDGMIRNKIVSGHTHKSVYLSEFISINCANIVFLLSYLIISLLLGRIFISNIGTESLNIISGVVCECMSVTSVTSIAVFIAVSVRHKTGGTVTCLFTMIFMFMSSWHIEQHSDNAVCGFLNNILPVNQISQLMDSGKSNSVLILYSLLLIITVNAVGIFIFPRINLR